MHILKKSALVAAVSLLGSTLSIFILTLGIWQVFSTPVQPKQALAESGIYADIVTGALDQANQKQGNEGIDVSNTEVKNTIVGCFPPNEIQKQTEAVIDDFYVWVQGKSQKLTFAFGLDQYKTCLSDSLAQHVQARLNGLPVCTTANSPPGDDVDALNATCRPPGLNVAAETEKFRQNILAGEFLGKNGQVSADTIKNEKGQTLTEQLKTVPEVYQKTKLGIICAGVLALLLAIAVVVLSINWRKGLRKVSIIAMVVGGFMVALGWLLGAAIRKASSAVNPNTDLNNQLQNSALSVVQILVDDLRNWWVGLGLGLAVLGIAALLTLHFTKPKDEIKEEKAEKEFTDSKNDDPEAWAQKLSTSKPAEAKPKTASAPKSKK